MKFYDVVDQVVEQLKQRGRVSYRALQLEFDLSNEHLDTLKEELIGIQELAVDKDGQMLMWIGASPVSSSELQVSSSPLAPRCH